MKRRLAIVLLWAFTYYVPANGADAIASMSLKAASVFAAYEWTGFYLGGHFGYGTGSFGPETNAEPLQGAFFPHSMTWWLVLVAREMHQQSREF